MNPAGRRGVPIERIRKNGMMRYDFAGKTAAITGAARGIGFECARIFAECGANIAMLDLLEKEGRESLERLRGLGADAELYLGDATDYPGMEKTFEEIRRRFGSIDICVCAAGIVTTAPFLESSPDEIRRVMDINVNGVIAPSRAAFVHMKERKGGKIVLISSTAGKTGGGFNGNIFYGVSKGAVIAYTKGLAREAGPYRINVNSVCPGPVETLMFASCTPENRARILAGSMFDKIASPVDIANSVVFLCSEFSGHMTSVIHTVDGGIMKGN